MRRGRIGVWAHPVQGSIAMLTLTGRPESTAFAACADKLAISPIVERRLREVRVHAAVLVAIASLPRWVRVRLRA